MQIAFSLKSLRRVKRPVALVAGFFDGVHLGHRKVIRSAMARAARLRGQAWVLTFDSHPEALLAPRRAPPLLTTTRYRLLQLARLGVDGCVVLPFTKRLAACEADDFFRELVACLPGGSELYVGANWRFGRGGAGDAKLLGQLADTHGLRATPMQTERRGGSPVSSTRIRSAIRGGKLGLAAQLLGRDFGVMGRVVHGRGIGIRLGFPTANVDTGDAMLPPCGIYAVWALVRGHAHRAVANIGVCPTFEGAALRKPILEVHLPCADAHLYGAWMEVLFVKKIRGERAFASPKNLRRRIEKDAADATHLLARKKAPKINFTDCIETDI